MFERYTEKARRVIFFARYEASQAAAQQIDSHHILLGLLREDKRLVHALFHDSTSEIDAIRNEIASRSTSHDRIHASVDLPLSSDAKEVLQYGADESYRLGHRHIGTDHLMLGLLRQRRSFAGELLHAHGVTAEKVLAYLGEEKPDESYDSNQTAEGVSRPLGLLVNRLAEKGVFTHEEFTKQLLGKDSLSDVQTAFNLLLDLLVSKGLISEDERREISTGER